MLFAAIQLILVVGAWFLAGYFLLPPLFRKLAKYISQETLTIVSVALCLFLVSIAAFFNYSAALGAFIMGSVLAETVLVNRIEELIVPIRDIFGAVFFISVGMLIDPTVIANQWQVVLFISLVVILGKITVISIGTFLTGQSIKTTVKAGFGMAQIGEFSFIIATLGISLNAINDSLYPVIVAVSGITTFTTPYLMRFSGYISESLERKMPERIKHFLDSYAAWVYRIQYGSKKNTLLGTISMRFFINAIIVAILFTLINKFVFPEIHLAVEHKQYAKILSELTAIIISSPFIWGMLFSYKIGELPEYAKSKLNPVVFITWLLTLVEIILVSVIYFYTFLTSAVLLMLVIIFFAVAYRHLEKSYHWFERQLVGNIKKPAKKSKYSELAPWETHFVEMIAGSGSIFLNKKLSDCQIRQLYGINIVAIYRGHHTILAPRGEEIIVEGDKLIVLGTDEQIELFNKQLAVESLEHQKECLDNFTLKAVLLYSDHPLIGNTIRGSKIRESMNGLIVGLERRNNRILNPAPEMVLEADDLLLIVSEEKFA